MKKFIKTIAGIIIGAAGFGAALLIWWLLGKLTIFFCGICGMNINFSCWGEGTEALFAGGIGLMALMFVLIFAMVGKSIIDP